MHIAQEYYLRGYIQQDFKDNDDLKGVLAAIHEIHNGDIKEGFSLKEKYRNTKDLRPNVFTYSRAFVDILFSNNIPVLLREVTGHELYLGGISLRILYHGAKYMGWHRDTTLWSVKTSGPIPPSHKIIFYPQTGLKPEPKLKVIPGSHRQMFRSPFLDRMQPKLLKHDTIYSSNSSFLLFNTTLQHSVVPEQQPQGSFRLFYAFCHEFELSRYNQDQLVTVYKNRLGEEKTIQAR